MNNQIQPGKPEGRKARPLPLKSTTAFILLLWSAAHLVFYNWQMQTTREGIEQQAMIEARSAFIKDVIYRQWNTGHGGVFAPVTEQTQPNPYLPDNVEKNAVTESGIALTLVNPAYMTRQVHELAFSEYNVRGHITSLNPIRPQNKPDEWEREALNAFESGEEEFAEIVAMDGSGYLRLMRPLQVTEGCLKCHEHQGYKVGDVRGGISVAVPMQPYFDALDSDRIATMLSQLALWSGGGLLIILGAFFINTRVKENEQYKAQLVESTERHMSLSKRLRASNTELELFSEKVTQNLRKNLRHIEGFNGLMVGKLKDVDPELYTHEQQVISNSMESIKSIVKKLDDFYRSTNKRFNAMSCNLSLTVKSIIDSLESDREEPLAEWDVQPDIRVKGDPQLLQIALEQLLANAIKFTKTRGQPKICFGENKVDGERVFFLSDNGTGFTVEEDAELFAPFVKVDNRYEEGIGIGLSIVQKIIERHNGRIWAEGDEGHGATFFFTIGVDSQ